MQGRLLGVSSNDWPEHREQVYRTQQAREAVQLAVAAIREEERVSQQVATRRLVEVAQRQRRPVADVAADVVRTGRLPEF